jgi:putative hemolysin
MPVYQGRVDDVAGYVSTRDLLYLALEQKLFVMEDILRPAFFAPETQRAVDLLHEMRRRRVPFAVIVDEQGGMSGICTLEDLVEELVGEILSEDAVPPPELVQAAPDGSAIILGTAPVPWAWSCPRTGTGRRWPAWRSPWPAASPRPASGSGCRTAGRWRCWTPARAG